MLTSRCRIPAALILLVVAGCSREVSVSIDTGRVSGVSDGRVVAYKGIPFAAPPVGNLRWRAPQRAPSWTGTLSATAYEPQCMQLGPPLPTMPVEKSSEDCLYLNLWAPASQAQSKRAVMVFLYGGGFRRGSASTPLYWGDELAGNHDVIVVNLAYRVGALGFLAHPELTAESPDRSSGNYGLLDVLAGLAWVQRNIAAFGGDPKNVTVFGQSAGAWALNKLMISPLAVGLFNKAIAESGGDMGPARTADGIAALGDAERVGVAFASSLNAKSIAELRQIPADRITASAFSGLSDVANYDGARPILDGYVIPADGYSVYASGKQADIPLLVGYNDDEGANLVQPIAAVEFVEQVHARYGGMAERFLQLYPATDEVVAARSQKRLTGEAWIDWHVWSWARLHAQTSHSKVFFYHFVGPPSFHGAELPYVFGQSSALPGESRELARIVATYWTHFAKTGDPNGAGLPQWPSFSEAAENTLYLSRTVTAGPPPNLPEHALMDTYMSQLRGESGSKPPQ